MEETTRRRLVKASRAVAAGALVAASPLTACGLLAANAYLEKHMAREADGRARKLALLGANAVMCVAAGAVSTAFACVPLALAAACALTWMFGASPAGRRSEPEVLDVEAKAVEDADA